MNHPNNTAPAEAYSPDANWVGTDASPRLPEQLVHLFALLIRFLCEHWLAIGHARTGMLPAWWDARPALPPGSIQALAASVRGAFGNQIAWTCRRRGIGPGHPDWPELSRTIVAFGGSVRGFRPGLPPCGLQWWENPPPAPAWSACPR